MTLLVAREGTRNQFSVLQVSKGVWAGYGDGLSIVSHNIEQVTWPIILLAGQCIKFLSLQTDNVAVCVGYDLFNGGRYQDGTTAVELSPGQEQYFESLLVIAYIKTEVNRENW